MTYIGDDGKAHQPIMIHRALLGSIERFFGILIEHFAGAFPTWLAPVQVKVLPITDQQASYGRQVVKQLRAARFRAELDVRNEKVGLKIREAEKAKVPFMLIVGEREAESQMVSVRKRGGSTLGAIKISEVLDLIQSDMPVEELTSSFLEE